MSATFCDKMKYPQNFLRNKHLANLAALLSGQQQKILRNPFSGYSVLLFISGSRGSVLVYSTMWNELLRIKIYSVYSGVLE
jgi:hypothetical protein